MTLENTARAQAARQPSFTLRLTFAYDPTGIRLTKSQRVEMIAPAAVSPPPQAGQAGFWLEVRDAGGNLLYARAIHDPLRITTEVFSEDPKASIARVPNPNLSGEFTLLVPDLPGAATFILNGTPPGTRPQLLRSQELLRLPFDQLRRS